MINERVLTQDTIPDSLPFKPTAKPEVIKKGKKVRVIYNESQANYMVLKHVFGDIVSLERNPASGRCIGMSSHEGASRMIFERWFHVNHRRNGGGAGPTFLTGLRPFTATSLTRSPGKLPPGQLIFGHT